MQDGEKRGVARHGVSSMHPQDTCPVETRRRGIIPLRIASEPVEKIKPWNRYLDARKARAERAKSVPLGSVEWAAEGSVPPLKSKFLDENWNMPACMLLNSLTSLSF